MMNEGKEMLTLDRPVTYQIKVPGELNESRVDWAGMMTMRVESVADGRPVTTLTGKLDQAVLQSLLRRLYLLGLAIISVACLDLDSGEKINIHQ